MRGLGRAPAFAALAVLTLGVGVGANTAIFSGVRAALLRPPPFERSDRLAIVLATDVQAGMDEKPVSFPAYTMMRDETRVFEDLAAWTSYADTKYNLSAGDGEPESVQYALVSASFFSVLGVRPAQGRTFLSDEDEPGAAPVVMLSDGIWRRRFAADPSIVGRSVVLEGRPFTVVGVLPPSFRFATLPQDAELWVPLSQDPVAARRYALPVHYLAVVARLRDGATFEQASAEMDRFGHSLAERFPDEQKGEGFRVLPLRGLVTRGLREALLMLMGAVGFVLLIACANVANLFLARASARSTELAVHASLGAGRGVLARKLLAESMLLALMGGALGVLLALWLTDLLALAPYGARTPYLPWRVPPESVRVDGMVQTFTLLLSLLTGVAFGLLPALRLSRVDPSTVLRAGTPGGGFVAGRASMRGALVVTQVALAFVLLSGAGLALRSLARLTAVDPGFASAGVLTADVRLTPSHYPDDSRVSAFQHALLEHVSALPGVSAAGMIDALPLSGIDPSSDFFIAGRAPFEHQPQTHQRVVSPAYFAALGVGLVHGRMLKESDALGAGKVALINETMAERFWPGEDPVGKRAGLGFEAFVSYDRASNTVRWDSAGALREIVGVVRDVRDQGPAQPATAQMYIPLAQMPRRDMVLVVRSADASALLPALRAQVAALDPEQPLANVNTLMRLEQETLARPRSNGLALSLFAGLALFIACVGVYGLLAYAVALRRHEIGVRLALGGDPGVVLRTFVARGMLLGALGIAIGLPVALAGGQLMRTLLFGVTPTDGPTLALAAAALAAATALACWVPARRAAAVDPAGALRGDN
jgi:predicted permease